LKKSSLFILICFISFFGYSQNKKFTDSILQTIQITKSDSLKSKIFYNSGIYSVQKYGNLKLFRIYIDSAMHYAKISNYDNLIAKSHFGYGLLERLEGNYDKALDHLEKNITYFENDSINKSYALFQKGTIYRKIGDLNNSLKTNLDILEIFETKKDSFAIASTLNSIAGIYGEMNNYDEAITNYKEAINIFIKKDKTRDVSNTNANIAVIYHRNGDNDKATIFAEDALKIAKENGFKDEEGSALSTLGTIHIKSNPDKALQYFLRAKKILDQTNFNTQKLTTNRGLGVAYFKTKKYDEAKNTLLNALKVAEEKKILHEVQPITKTLAEIAVKESDFKLAYNYRLKYTAAKDTIFNTENSKNINLLQKQFETEKKDKEIAQQQLDLEKSKAKTQTMTILIISLLLASILLWFVFQQRQKRIQQQLVAVQKEQEVLTLESLIAGEEKERLRIAKELHDGVNGDLSAIKYKLSSLLKMNNEVITEAVTMIDNSCQQVRAISHNLVPPSLKDFNLIEAVSNYCENMNNTHQPEIDFQHIGEAIELNKKVEINIFRIIQELVTNAVKHAKAKTIDVQISNRNNTLLVTVEDNGEGYKNKTEETNGIGMNNIRSRAEYLNADLEVITNKNGTSNTIEIDLNKIE